MTLSTFTIKAQIRVGFAAILSFLIVIAVLSSFSMTETNERLKHVSEINSVKISHLADMSNAIHIMSKVMRSLVLITDETAYEKELLKFGEARENYNRAFEQLKKMPLNTKGKAFVAEIKKITLEVQLTDNKFLETAKKDKVQGADYLFKQADPMTTKWHNNIQSFIDLQLQKNKAEEIAAANDYAHQNFLLITFSVIAVLASLLIAEFITRLLYKQLGAEPLHVKQIANQIATGDLTIDIDVSKADRESLLTAIKNMRDSFSDIVSKVTQSTGTIATASQEISAGNMDLSSRSASQASTLEETAASIEELTSTVRKNADNAGQANQLAASASDIASKGGQMVGQVISTMTAIDTSSKKIVDIISVIDGIAFQTNILALNAAVEAARAGEQGRGFAVVASEVRSLAQRSAEAAKEVKHLIFDTVDKVVNGTKLVNDTGKTIEEVVESVKKVSHVIGEITAASHEQTTGIDHINLAITQLDDTTQQNTALVEEATAAAHALDDQVMALNQLVSTFKVSNNYAAQINIPPQRFNAVTPAQQKKKSQLITVNTKQAKQKNNHRNSEEEFEEF